MSEEAMKSLNKDVSPCAPVSVRTALLQGCLAHEYLHPPWHHRRDLGIGLLQGFVPVTSGTWVRSIRLPLWQCKNQL